MDTAGELAILRELHGCFTAYKNFFQPTMKLVEKVRVEGKIHRKYDQPKPPYQGLIESGQISATAPKALMTQYESPQRQELRRAECWQTSWNQYPFRSCC